MSELRKGQHKDETTMEFLRRVVSNLDHEPGSMLDELKTVDAVLDYFGLWSDYDTDMWVGVIESISDGESPEPALAFIKKHNLPDEWKEDVIDAVEKVCD